MATNQLLLTTGHNSSAIYLDNNGEVIGYEQERIDNIKSSSNFPIDAINEISKNIGFIKTTSSDIFINHWFDRLSIKTNGNLSNTDCEKIICSKYINKNFVSEQKNKISTNTLYFTHHDSHMLSSYLFFKHFFKEYKDKESLNDDIHFIVLDGFGNNQEIFSLYKGSINDIMNKDKAPNLINRKYRYRNSLGLFYQYATSFVGLKENQDEYKFLGYESIIDMNFKKEQILKVLSIAESVAESFTDHLCSPNKKPANKDFNINLNDLNDTKSRYYKIFDSVIAIVSNEEITRFSHKAKIIIGYFIQSVIEKFIENLIKREKINNVVLSGGCFYNVKLNNKILKSIPGIISIMPIAGDQGAAIGKLYYDKELEKKNLDKLFTFTFGKRDLSNIEKFSSKFNKCKIVELNDESVEEIGKLLGTNKIVNIVYGDMEFGPRALCHTSTLFKPSQTNADINNAMNGRAEIMPTAPVMLEEQLEFFFEDHYKRVIGSDRFMIITYDYKIKFENKFSGIMHKYPASFTNMMKDKDKFSGRPQVIYNEEQNPLMFKLLKYLAKEYNIKALTNTSFNVHGNPIVYNAKQIIDNYASQVDMCIKKSLEIPYLYIIK